MAGRGTFVAAERSRGTWSEVVLVRDLREVSGNVVFQAVLTSERSRRTRVGEGWLLVQVKGNQGARFLLDKGRQ